MNHYGVIGFPVKHSRSPEIHNQWFRQHQLNASYVHLEVAPENLAGFMKSFRKNYAGASVTIPHKETILAYLDEVDPMAREIGAVNTLWNDGGVLKGFNTDWLGALRALVGGNDFSSLKNKTILIIGAGGAAKAMAYAARYAGANLVVLNRTLKRAKTLATTYNGQSGSLADYKKFQPDIVINATSIGLTPNDQQTPLEKKYFTQPVVVMDMVFNPLETRLLKEAQSAGCQAITGDRMLYYQAQEAFKIWTGILPQVPQSFSQNSPPKSSPPSGRGLRGG